MVNQTGTFVGGKEMNIAEKERKSNPKKVYFVLANKRAFHVPVQHFPLKK
jgi:hypothetical protein